MTLDCSCLQKAIAHNARAAIILGGVEALAHSESASTSPASAVAATDAASASNQAEATLANGADGAASALGVAVADAAGAAVPTFAWKDLDARSQRDAMPWAELPDLARRL